VNRPRALDLFCGAGGASMGLHRAGFDVVGVDIEPQPHYPFTFIQTDAFAVLTMLAARRGTWIDGRAFDLIWASPPCQGRTAYRRRPDHVAPVDTDGAIARVRDDLTILAMPSIIENVPGAPLISPITLCGSMFGLDVQRHRIFECSFPVTQPACDHSKWTPRFPPATNRTNKRRTVEVGVWRIPLETQQAAMGIDWMQLEELSQAIPPAYAEYLGRAALAAMERAA
jgi:DNA (cytosine-5)-methyltransferase 1